MFTCSPVYSDPRDQVEESCNEVRIGLARADHATSIVLGAGGGFSYTSEGHRSVKEWIGACCCTVEGVCTAPTTVLLPLTSVGCGVMGLEIQLVLLHSFSIGASNECIRCPV